MGIWSLIWGMRLQIGLALIAAIIGGYFLVLKAEIRSLNNKVSDMNVTLAEKDATLQKEITLNAVLQTSIENLKKLAEQKKKNSEWWKKQYEGRVKDIQLRLGGLGSWTAGPDEADCAAAKRLLKEYRK